MNSGKIYYKNRGNRPKNVDLKKVACPPLCPPLLGNIIQNLKERMLPVAKSTVGLDVGSFSIKAVELKRVSSELELVNFAVTPKVTPHESDISRKKLSELIKRTFSETNFDTRVVNTSVSGQAVIVRYIQLPQMNEEDLRSAIKFEAEKYIPFKIDEVILDCQILEENIGDNKMRVLLVSAKREFIDNHIKLLSDAGLEVQLIDVDSLALINAFQANLSSSSTGMTCALLNIGARQTNINIIKNGNPCFSRDVMSAGDDLTKAIKDGMNIDFSQAERLKCEPKRKKEELFKFIQPILDNLATEVRLSFDYYESQFEKGIDKLYLSGGSCSLSGLDKFLADSLGVDVGVWNPVTALRINPEIDRDKLSSLRSQLPIAIGLAIR